MKQVHCQPHKLIKTKKNPNNNNNNDKKVSLLARKRLIETVGIKIT